MTLRKDESMTNLLAMEQKVPNFTLADIDGNTYDLYSDLNVAPRVLVFRRGGW